MNRPTMEVFDMYIFRFGLKQLDYSYATAVGILRSIAGLIMLIMVNQLSKRLDGSSVA
jgi:putative aldouronate transport system permease protein